MEVHSDFILSLVCIQKFANGKANLQRFSYKTGVLKPCTITAVVSKGMDWGFFYFWSERQESHTSLCLFPPQFLPLGSSLLDPWKSVISEGLDGLSGAFQLHTFPLDFSYCSEYRVTTASLPFRIRFLWRQNKPYTVKHAWHRAEWKSCPSISVCLSLARHAHMCTGMCAHMYTHTHAYIHVHTCKCICTHTEKAVFICQLGTF